MQRKILLKSEQDSLDCLQFDFRVLRCGLGIKSIELTCKVDDQVQVGQVIGKIIDQQDQVKDIAVRVPGWIVSVTDQPFRLTDPAISLCKIVKCKHEEFEESELKHMRLCLKCGEELWIYPNKSVGVVTARNLSEFESDKKNIDYSRQHIEIMFSSFLKKNEIVLPGSTLFKGQILYDDNDDEEEDSEEIRFSLKECVRLVEFNRSYKDDDSWILKYEKIICSHQKIDSMNFCEFCNAHVTNHSNLSYAGLSSEHKSALIGTDYAIRQKNLAVQQLSSNKKLILVLDLDNTILHAIQAVPQATFNQIAQDDVCEFYNQSFFKYVIRIRPYLKEFLQLIVPHFEIYIFTMAIFDYAKAICEHIRKVHADILQDYPQAFSVDRILSRDQIEKSNKNLSKILPDSDKIMLILDDRSDVWLKHSGNLLTTLPYIYWGEGDNSWNGSAFKAVVKIISNANAYFEKMRKTKTRQNLENPSQSNQTSLPVSSTSSDTQVSSNPNIISLLPKDFSGQKIQEGICQKYDNVEQYQKKQHFAYQLSIIKDVDNYLLFAGPLLTKLKDDFYSQEEDSRDIRQIFSQYQRSVLKGVKIAITSIIVKNITQETSIICQQFAQLGGQIVDNFNSADEINYLLIGGPTRTHKVKNAQHFNIPIISDKWVQYCWFYNYKLDPNIFAVSSDLSLKKTNQQIEQEICNRYPSQAKLF